MKYCILAIFACTATISNAQTILKSSFRQLAHSIKDDGKALQMKIDGQRQNGEELHYKQTFDVSGLAAPQIDSLKSRILDSLKIAYAFTQPTISQPVPSSVQDVQFICENCDTKGHLEIHGGMFLSTHRVDNRNKSKAFPIKVPLGPGEYQFVYYRRKKSQSVPLSFTVKQGEKMIVTIN